MRVNFLDNSHILTYQCWNRKITTIKLTASLDGRPWAVSAPPSKLPSGLSTPDRPNSSQSLRKTRGAGRANTLDRQSSPSNLEGSMEEPSNQKATNEAFFESLGAVSFCLYHSVGLELTDHV